MPLHFLAFSAADSIHAETIASAGAAASSADVNYRSWSRQDASGSPLGASVEAWIDEAEAVVADLTYVNDNVTYEIGYTIGARKALRLIRNSTIPTTEMKSIGLLDTLLRDEFRTQPDLEKLLRNRPAKANTFRLQPRNRNQTLFVLARLYVAWNKKDAAKGVLRTLIVDHADSSVAGKAKDLLKSLERDRK